MLDRGSKSPIGITQRVLGRPSVSLWTLPNIGPTFLQRGGDSQGCGAADSGTPGKGTGRGRLVRRVGTSPGAYAEGLTAKDLTGAGVATLMGAWVSVRWPWLAAPRGCAARLRAAPGGAVRGPDGASSACRACCMLRSRGVGPRLVGEVSGAGLRSVSGTYLLIEDCVLLQVTEV